MPLIGPRDSHFRLHFWARDSTPFTLGSTEPHLTLNIPKALSAKPHVVPLYKRHPRDRFATRQGIGQNPPLEFLLHSLAVCSPETGAGGAWLKQSHDLAPLGPREFHLRRVEAVGNVRSLLDRQRRGTVGLQADRI